MPERGEGREREQIEARSKGLQALQIHTFQNFKFKPFLILRSNTVNWNHSIHICSQIIQEFTRIFDVALLLQHGSWKDHQHHNSSGLYPWQTRSSNLQKAKRSHAQNNAFEPLYIQVLGPCQSSLQSPTDLLVPHCSSLVPCPWLNALISAPALLCHQDSARIVRMSWIMKFATACAPLLWHIAEVVLATWHQNSDVSAENIPHHERTTSQWM